MKKIVTLTLALCVLFNCIIFSSCNKKVQKFTAQSFEYFDTLTVITGYATSREEFDQTVDEIFSKLSFYHKLFDIYNSYDGVVNIHSLNQTENGKHKILSVERDIIDLLKTAKEMHRKTNGAVNIAMGSVLSIWHEYRTEGTKTPSMAKIPPLDLLQEAAWHTDIDNVIIDEQNSTVFLADDKMSLDVGAIAKGYAAEMTAKHIESMEITSFILNVGGNVRTIGKKPNGDFWTAGIENPDNTDGDYIAQVKLGGQSLVTSGSYQRYYTVEGKRYHHIIHPDTLMPSNEFTSVSVICTDSALGDALSTALFCMDYENGKTLIESIPDAEAMWITEKGETKFSSNWNKYSE